MQKYEVKPQTVHPLVFQQSTRIVVATYATVGVRVGVPETVGDQNVAVTVDDGNAPVIVAVEVRVAVEVTVEVPLRVRVAVSDGDCEPVTVREKVPVGEPVTVGYGV